MNINGYQLVISDIRMPQMNGFEFIKKVKEMQPQIKVFLMTAFEINDVEFRRVLPSTRIDEFIQQPVSLQKLNSLVMNHTIDQEKCTRIPGTGTALCSSDNLKASLLMHIILYIDFRQNISNYRILHT
jgi:response regulator RpfG family c-di-GMP phosphodiesterase